MIGCNAYLGDLQPDLGGKVLPAGSYILATQVLEKRLRGIQTFSQNYPRSPRESSVILKNQGLQQSKQ